jgi:hypothetical protein
MNNLERDQEFLKEINVVGKRSTMLKINNAVGKR